MTTPAIRQQIRFLLNGEAVALSQVLPDETLLYPGHLYSSEPFATMGATKRRNPYLRAATVEQFLSFVGY